MNKKEKYAVITDKGLKITYDELEKLEAAFVHGIKRGSLILILCGNNIETLTAYTGCLKNGIVPIMVSAGINGERLAEIIDNYKPGYLWIPQKYEQKAAEYIRSGEPNRVYQYGSYSLFQPGILQSDENTEISIYKDLALLLSTSGSTGSSKLVRLSKDNIRTNTLDIIESLKICENDRAVTTLPMHYTYGLSVINTHLYAGGVILLTEEKIISNDFWVFFNENNGTSFAGVPYTYEIMEKLKLYKKLPDSLKTMTQAGGRLGVELQKKICAYAERNGIDFYVMYGQTEATARVTCMKSTLKQPLGSVGKPVGREDVIISEGGEVVVKGKNISLGYAMNHGDLSKGDENKGILYTGDMGYKDGEGYLYICGRMDRMAKIYGNRISLDELEGLLGRGFPGYTFISLVYGNKIIIFSDVKEKDEIPGYLSGQTGFAKIVFHIIPVCEIVRKENGKIDYKYYKELLKKWQTGDANE